MLLEKNEIIDQINIIEILEEKELDYHEKDCSIFRDIDFNSHIETLKYNGLNDNHILELSNRLYGEFIDFYYISNDDIYIMILGVR